MENSRTQTYIELDEIDESGVAAVGSDYLDYPSLPSTRAAEWFGAIQEVIRERETDEEWEEYLRLEWEERDDEHGFRCDFAAKAVHMHGPCFVYRPDKDGNLALADVIDPVTRKSLDICQ